MLKFVTCLRILLFLYNKSIVHFAGGGGLGVRNLFIFGGRHKGITSNFKNSQPKVFLEKVIINNATIRKSSL